MAKQRLETSPLPGAKPWHATLPVAAGILSCLSTVLVIGAAVWLLQAVDQLGADAPAITKKDDAVRSMTARLAEANPILEQASKVASLQGKLLEIEATVKEQESLAVALKQSTEATIKEAKAKKGGAKEVAALKADLKKKLSEFAAAAKAAEAGVEPLEEERDRELRVLVTKFAKSSPPTVQNEAPAAEEAQAPTAPDAQSPSAAKESAAEDARVPSNNAPREDAAGSPGNGKGVEQ